MDAPQFNRPSPTAFVLAGGGSLGAVEVGMLEALLAWDEAPAFVVGTSAGAINAAYFAGDPTCDGVERLRALWCSIRRREILPIELRSIITGLFGRRGYLVDSRGLRELLERHLSYAQLESAAIPVHIVASDIINGREVVLSAGSVVDAVLASTAIPGVFPPVKIGSHMLVDGGVANNAPISVAVALGAKRVVVLPTGFTCAPKKAPQGAIARAMHAVSKLVAGQLTRDAEHWMASHIELRIVPSLCPLATSPYDYSAAEDLIARARTSTRVWLEAGGLESGEIPGQLYEHQHGARRR
jgi:NTE family protein